MVKRLFVAFVISILVIVGIPYFLEYVIFRSHIYSPVSNDGWASFFGSFLGSIIGFAGIAATLFFSKKENNRIIEMTKAENDRVLKETREENTRMIRAELRPYFAYIYSTYIKKPKEEQSFYNPSLIEPNHYFIDGDESNFNSGNNKRKVIRLKNLGLRTALNYDVVKYNVEFMNKSTEAPQLYQFSFLHEMIKYIEKDGEGLIILPYGNNGDYRCELVTRYEDVAGNVYYERLLIEDNKVVVLNRDEDKPSFSLDAFKPLTKK